MVGVFGWLANTSRADYQGTCVPSSVPTYLGIVGLEVCIRGSYQFGMGIERDGDSGYCWVGRYCR